LPFDVFDHLLGELLAFLLERRRHPPVLLGVGGGRRVRVAVRAASDHVLGHLAHQPPAGFLPTPFHRPRAFPALHLDQVDDLLHVLGGDVDVAVLILVLAVHELVQPAHRRHLLEHAFEGRARVHLDVLVRIRGLRRAVKGGVSGGVHVLQPVSR
jgi:hypothetical protein